MTHTLTRFTLIDSLVEQLERGILAGDYPPDAMLPSEAALSLEFDVSRPVVREALARLRERGYIETINGKGTFVRKPTMDAVSQSMLRHLQAHVGGDYSVDQVYEARRAIELEATRLAATRASEADLQALERSLETMRKAMKVDPEAYTAADVGFHLQIAEATQNRLFGILSAPLVDIIVHGMFESVRMVEEGMERGVAEHAAILQKLRAGDGEGARAEMAQHLERSRQVHPAKVVGVVQPVPLP